MRLRLGALARLAGQERAVANARAAATRLSRQRVDRAEVELYLQEGSGPDDPDQPAQAPASSDA